MNITKYVTILTLGGVLAFAQTTTQPKAKAVPRPVAAATIPKGAVKTPEGAYRYKDAQGKSWIYRETPFGVSRVPDTPKTAAAGSVQTPFGMTKTSAAAPVAARPAATNIDPTEHVTATAKGDTIQFQKPTPFGMTSWRKNKSDLTPDEQKVWDREQAKGTR